MDARSDLRKKRQLPPTLPNPPVPEHPVSPKTAPVRRLPIGAEPQPGGAHFRVWAPRCHEVVVEIEGLEPAAL